MTSPVIEDVDVVVIGAGSAGLAAADALAQAGRSYVVLEAQPIVGGRAQTVADAHGFLDLGAAYVGEHQNFLNMYLQRFDIETMETHLPDNEVWLYQHRDGRVEALPGDDPYALPEQPGGGHSALMTMYALNQLSIQVRALGVRPWNALNARLWDTMTVAQWLERTLPDKGDQLTWDLVTVATRAAFSLEPSELSFLWFLYYAGASGCFQNLVGVTSHPEGRRFTHGSRALFDALADAVGRDRIRMGQPVRGVSQDEQSVSVRTDTGTYRGRAAIVCMSPINSLKLDYEPPLDALPGGADRVRLCNQMTLGTIIKVFVHFKRPFWREQGQSGRALAMKDGNESPLVWTLDNCWEPSDSERRAEVRHPYSLMAFIVGDKARYWSQRPLAERREAVLGHLESIDGTRVRAELIEEDAYHEKDWTADAWAGGGPCGHLRPGCLTQFGAALWRPVGRIHWASTELGTEWCGYISGALQSGLAAASDVIQQLEGVSARG